MSQAVVLEDGTVVDIAKVSDQSYFAHETTNILFNSNGRVTRFKAENQFIGGESYYLALYNPAKNGDFHEYFPEVWFWETRIPRGESYKIQLKQDDIRFFRLSEDFFSSNEIAENTLVHMVKKEIDERIENTVSIPFLKISVKKFHFKKNENDYPDNNRYTVLNNKLLNGVQPISFSDITDEFHGYKFDTPYQIEINQTLRDYYSSIKYLGFLKSNGSSQFNERQKLLISDIVFLLNEMLYRTTPNFMPYLESNGLYSPFEEHFDLISNLATDSENSMSISTYHNFYTEKYFSIYRLRLIEFRSWVVAQFPLPIPLTGIGRSYPAQEDVSMRIIGLFNKFELQRLTLQTKKDLLQSMLEKNYFLTGDWNPLPEDLEFSEEEAVVKIIESIAKEVNQVLNYQDINDFMDLLNTAPFFDRGIRKTLYELLYSRLHDNLFFGDDGKGNRGRFVKAVYLLWINSKYNPENADIFSSVQTYSYTNHHAAWEFEYEDYFNEHNEHPSLDLTAAPSVIPYESEKILLWYFDNFNFTFGSGNTIRAWRDSSEFELVSYTPIVEGKVRFGTYDIFQPIAIARTNKLETIIGIPIRGETNTPCGILNSQDVNNPESAYMNNSFPIFYLKYIDDLGDYSDGKETVGVIVDVVTTFIGGVGLYKAGVRGADLFRKFLIGLVDIDDLAPVFRKLGFSLWELSLGVASSAYNIVNGGCSEFSNSPCEPPAPGDPNYDDFVRCQATNAFLFALELLTLSGDVLARRYFKNATHKLNLSIPEGLPETNQWKPLKDLLPEIDTVTDDVANFIGDLDLDILTRIENLGLNQTARTDFMNDFINATSEELTILADSDAIAVERWFELRNISFPDRRSFEILTDIELFDKVIRFCSRVNINDGIRTFSTSDKIKFVEYYSRDPFDLTSFILNDSILDAIDDSSERVELMVEYFKKRETIMPNKLKPKNFFTVISSDLPANHIEMHVMKLVVSQQEAMYTYSTKVNKINRAKQETIDMRNSDIEPFISLNLSNRVKNRLSKFNKLFVDLLVEDPGGAELASSSKVLLSGPQGGMERIFGTNNVPDFVQQPYSWPKFNIFNLDAIDRLGLRRINDTELMLIFNLLNNTNWTAGNRITVTCNSVLDTCGSCQSYFGYLIKLAERKGIYIEINVISDQSVMSMGQI